ncbi:MAG: hypothetical protein MJ137_07720 [Clostridia bacterium]|nr:hypothetical protein [Clostridia bacterium]
MSKKRLGFFGSVGSRKTHDGISEDQEKTVSISGSYRLLVPGILFAVICLLYTVTLVRTVAEKKDVPGQSESDGYTTRTVSVQAVRGEIYDRNGVKLVANVYNDYLYFDYSLMPYGNAEKNKCIAGVMDIVDRLGIRDMLCDSACPLQGTFPYYNYDLEMLSGTIASGRFKRIREYLGLDENVGAAEYAMALAKKTGMLDKEGKPLYSDERMTDLIRIRYEMEAIRFAPGEPLKLLEGLTVREKTAFLESGISGIRIGVSYSREYLYPGYASHILGRVGKIQAANAEYYTSLGYPVTATVGLDGCEKAFEEYLRGMDGTMVITEDKNGSIVSSKMLKETAPGLDVYLTIDIELQIRAEDALAENVAWVVAEAAKSGKKFEGEDCDAAAMVVEKVGTGELLAVASYPSFNLATFGKDYNDLLEDSRTPLFNRALNGTYAPGSTFKVGVAVGALTDGTKMPDGKTFTASTLIRDEGKYRYYDDYQPECWVYAYGHANHGSINVTKAIQVSCNCFFYELGRLMEIDNINKYCRLYGLGQSTGIELPESVGVLADSIYTSKLGVAWTGGLTIQTAIGQGYNRFTPLQLANYTSMIVDGGKRYSLHLLNEVKDFGGKTVYSASPELAASFEIGRQTTDTIKDAMSKVVEENSTVTAFDGFAVRVGGKTGTAQVTGQSSNAVFIAFAPLEKPEITVSCVLERGAHGTNAARSIRSVMEKYFGYN